MWFILSLNSFSKHWLQPYDVARTVCVAGLNRKRVTKAQAGVAHRRVTASQGHMGSSGWRDGGAGGEGA